MLSVSKLSSRWLRALSPRGVFLQPKHSGYSLLDDDDSTTRRNSPYRWFSPSQALQSRNTIATYTSNYRNFFICLGFFLLGFVLVESMVILSHGIPPSYDKIRLIEQSLLQHNLSLPYPEGARGRYVRFPGRNTGHGLNNFLQEVYFMAHVAFLSNRGFVFEEYTWSNSPLPFTVLDGALVPSRIPLNAFVAGPISGADLPNGHPRAISAKWWWDAACPVHERVVIDPRGAPLSGDGKAVMDWWVDILSNTPGRCIEVSKHYQVFHPMLFASSRILSAWPSMSESPILKRHRWSPLVQAAVASNQELFSGSNSNFGSEVVPGLLAMHVRRGDFSSHCRHLANEGIEYSGHNQFPDLPDRFDPGALVGQDRLDYYMTHCWPSIDDIVEKARQVRETTRHANLTHVYLLTNGEVGWTSELTTRLVQDGWSDVKSTFVLALDSEQKYVSGAVDMAIAERAEAFIGNGFSTLTSNVVMYRALKGLPPANTRFW